MCEQNQFLSRKAFPSLIYAQGYPWSLLLSLSVLTKPQIIQLKAKGSLVMVPLARSQQAVPADLEVAGSMGFHVVEIEPGECAALVNSVNSSCGPVCDSIFIVNLMR